MQITVSNFSVDKYRFLLDRSFMNKILNIAILAAALTSVGSVSAAEVKALYDKQCAKCHGPDGKGQTKMGKQSGAKDYTDPKVQAAFSDEQAAKAIKEGVKAKGKEVMKPIENASDEDIRGLIAYVRAFAKK
jgi:mono/diheme cytochrome c family protein